ncbi:MAG TPA: helix-turn-helix domain-containing protein [Acidimicrobiales bacterium]|nr:helix-turn-helix domain-containing protein [Acidimicrobiales bacterium]
MGRRSGVTAAETRHQLLSAAADVFADKGYEGARVSEIARSAQLTTGAIYAHYPTKADLLLEALRSHGAEAVAHLLSQGAAQGSLLEALGRVGSELPRRSARKGRLLLEAVVAGRRDRRVREVLSAELVRREALLAGLLRQAQEKGEVDATLSPEAVSRLVTLISAGALLVGAVDLEPVDQKDWTQLIYRVVATARPKGEQ